MGAQKVVEGNTQANEELNAKICRYRRSDVEETEILVKIRIFKSRCTIQNSKSGVRVQEVVEAKSQVTSSWKFRCKTNTYIETDGRSDVNGIVAEEYKRADVKVPEVVETNADGSYRNADVEKKLNFDQISMKS